MAREYAKNWFSMWTDDDFCRQPRFDKLFYNVLCGQRSVNNAGVFPINFTRWRKAMRDGDQEATDLDLKAALIRMQRRRYVFIDEEAGEGLIRSHIRRDEVYKQPNVLLSALRFLGAFDSQTFAAVMLAEIDRIDLPEIKSGNPSADRLRANLKQVYADARTHLATLSEGLVEPLPEPFGEAFPEGLPEPFPRPAEIGQAVEPFEEGFGEPPVVVQVQVEKSPLVGGQVGEVGDKSATNGQTAPNPGRNEPPPERCPKHINDAAAPACGACAGHRRFRERWNETHAAAAVVERADFWDAVRRCPDCDDNGLIDEGNRTSRCLNHDWTQKWTQIPAGATRA